MRSIGHTRPGVQFEKAKRRARRGDPFTHGATPGQPCECRAGEENEDKRTEHRQGTNSDREKLHKMCVPSTMTRRMQLPAGGSRAPEGGGRGGGPLRKEGEAFEGNRQATY